MRGKASSRRGSRKEKKTEGAWPLGRGEAVAHQVWKKVAYAEPVHLAPLARRGGKGAIPRLPRGKNTIT